MHCYYTIHPFKYQEGNDFYEIAEWFWICPQITWQQKKALAGEKNNWLGYKLRKRDMQTKICHNRLLSNPDRSITGTG